MQGRVSALFLMFDRTQKATSLPFDRLERGDAQPCSRTDLCADPVMGVGTARVSSVAPVLHCTTQLKVLD